MRATVRHGFALAALLPLFLVGCAGRQQIMSTPEAAVQPTPEPTARPALELRHYVVKKGDNLWAIAARKRVLDDPFDWPLLYRLNRDEIKDPNLIYPSQDLTYKGSLTPEELKEIRDIARSTPAYHPKHRRKTLPVH
jgi:hypothetical protein